MKEGDTMARRLLVMAAALAAACAPRGPGPATAPAPSPTATLPDTLAIDPAAAMPTLPGPEAVRYGPSAVRYVIHRRMHVTQVLAGQAQAQNLGARVYVAATITGPADSVGYPAMFLVDSVVPDSGTPPPVADPIRRARRLVFSGRLAPRGEFVHAAPSDTGLTQSVLQLVGNFRDFLPRLPVGGVRPGSAWTDTVETAQQGRDAEGSRRAIVHASATGWEDHGGVQSLRIETSQSYNVTGSGKNLGQPFELVGAGSARGTAFIAVDGRYLGGESRDSASLTIRLPVQGVSIPVTQITGTTVTVLP